MILELGGRIHAIGLECLSLGLEVGEKVYSALRVFQVCRRRPRPVSTTKRHWHDLIQSIDGPGLQLSYM